MKKQIYEWGDEENTTLLFLHGLGSTGLSFIELAQYLPDFHLVAFDMEGHGTSKALSEEEDYLPSRIVQKMKEVINEINKPDLFIVGHSWGAHLALYYAKTYPELTKGIILLDGGYLPNSIMGSLEEELDNLENFYNSLRFPSWEAFIESEKSELPRWSKELETASRAQVMEKEGEIRFITSIFTAKSIVKGIYAEPTETVFPKIKQPLLLIRSTLPEEMESIRQESSNYLQEMTPESVVRTIPNTTHDIYRDAPEEVAATIKSWVLGNLERKIL